MALFKLSLCFNLKLRANPDGIVGVEIKVKLFHFICFNYERWIV